MFTQPPIFTHFYGVYDIRTSSIKSRAIRTKAQIGLFIGRLIVFVQQMQKLFSKYFCKHFYKQPQLLLLLQRGYKISAQVSSDLKCIFSLCFPSEFSPTNSSVTLTRSFQNCSPLIFPRCNVIGFDPHCYPNTSLCYQKKNKFLPCLKSVV